MTFVSQSKNVKTISGYFLATDPSDASNECDDDDDENDDDDGNNDEFDNVDFSEDKAFSPETHVLKPNAEKQRKVRFKEYGGDTVHEIYGHFPLTDPWWSASLRVRSHQKTRHLVAICGYRLRNDEFVASEKVVMLFLKAKKVHDDHKAAFEEHLRLSSSSGLTFENLHDQLQAFADAAISNKEIAKQIQERVKQDDNVQNARRFRKIYEILPQLLPKHFFNIIQLDVETLDNLENALSVQPWVFGFSSLLTRFHNLHGCEASFKNFCHCSEVFNRLSDVEKDGLFIYGVLKDKCQCQGHTFVELWSLKTWKIRRNWNDDFLKYSVVDWNKGLLFLETHRIIVLNEHQRHPAEHLAAQSLKSDTRVYLSRFYFAERDIAADLENLMFRGTHPKCDVQIDFESEHFERLRADEDQMKAAELIATRPVVVLSGKGGCGKTEVVGRVFSYARKAAAQERLFNHDSLTDEELMESVDKQMSLYYAASTQHHLDCTKQESPSTSNCALGNGESYQTSDVSEVNSREMEAIVRYPPTQNYIKQEEKDESIVTLSGTQDYRGNDLTETQDNSTASPPIANHIGDGRILLTAPTGKAAVLLGRRSGMQGYTLHQVVYSYFAWKRNLDKAWKPNSDEARKRNSNDAWKFESVQVLIVDECSLVPVTIFQRVLKALLADAQLSKVVLLGDVHQLPSIEPGRFLVDVYEALKDAGCSINLRTNHRSESQFIVDNAERILQQRLPIVNPLRHFHQINLPGNKDSEDNDRDEAVRGLLKGGILLDHYRSQFVAFRRKDCDGINELCCKHYNKHSMMKPAKNGKQTLDFRPGDKVCCSRNAYVVDYNGSADSFLRPANSSKDNGKAKGLPQIRLCNGEIFFIDQMHEVQERGKAICYVVLSDVEREIKVDLRELKNLCKLKHAWARTIHTFQGSETDALVYVVGSAGSYQNWQHVYTAVTRGKQQVHIITEPNCLQRAVMRTPIQRKTSLKQRLQLMIATQLPQSSSHPLIQDQSKTTDVINSVGCNSTGETSASSASSLDDGLDFATPVKARPPPNQNLKSVSGGKRKRADPSVGCTMENSLADSLASPLKRKLTLKDEC